MSRRITALAWVLAAWSAYATGARAQSYGRNLIPTQAVQLDGQPLTPLARVGLERAWYTAIPISRTERLMALSLSEGMLFAQTSDAGLYAYDAESGRFLWGVNLGERSSHALPVSANSREIFATAGETLFAIDRASGKIAWSRNLDSIPSSGTAASEDLVVVGLSSGKLATFGTSNRDPGFVWQTGGPLTSQPILAGPVVAFASQDDRVYVSVQDPPKLIYRYLTGGPISASLATHGARTLIVPSEDNNLYAIDLFTGDTRWTQTTGSAINQQPLVTSDEVFSINSRGKLDCVEAESGRRLWTLETGGGRLLAVAESKVFLMTGFNDLFVVDRRTGRMVADPRAVFEGAGLNLREYTVTPTNSLTGRLYLGTPSGLVLCLRELGQVQPVPLRDPSAPPFGFIPRRGEGQEPNREAPEGEARPDEAPAMPEPDPFDFNP